MNVAHNLEAAAMHFPNRVAVIDRGRKWTYAAFNRESDRFAAALAACGIIPGDCVALCAPNSFEWLAFYFGALKAGAVAATFSHLLSADELRKITADCRPRAMFTSIEKGDDLRKAHGIGALVEMVVHDDGAAVECFKEKGDSRFRVVDRPRHTPAVVLYTGGTTGTPKGALLSHENILFSTGTVARYERSSEKDVALCFLPLNHVFAQIHILQSTVYSGGALVLEPAFDAGRILDAVRRYRITRLYAVPTVYIRMLGGGDLREPLASVRYCFSAAASMAKEVVGQWRRATGLAIYEAYGMTESASMVTYNHYYRHVIGSVGTPVNLVEVQVRDADGALLGNGREGEICIRGPNITCGYLNNPAETRAAFYGDWFRSGDIGYLDEKGYLFIVDRLKDLIITGGENVYPREVEEVLYTRPEIRECAVVGLPDREYGERVVAFVVSDKQQPVDPARLKNYLKTRLAGFKVPKEIVAVDSLPKNNAGKLLKREIREKYGAETPDGAAV
ncbi:MAG: AMP-binding protein [Deltaproteobacteria bacterium SG8_13]|nr:MAG: AMP-binding protein [Deltaproteobacteria bacterium SG8_13]